MALTFIAGPSGCGKSHYIYNRIIKESAKDKETNFFVLVPDQFTMQTQKELVRLHPCHSILNIDVLSFNRLAQRVFDETGFTHEPILEEMGKTLVIQKVIWDNRKKLSILEKTMQMPGGAAEAKSMISELMQYCIDEEKLAKIRNEKNIPPLLSKKLEDIRIIYRGMKDYLQGKYLAAEETNEALSFELDKSALIKDSIVVFDGFTGFLPMQLPVVEKILKLAREVYVVVTAGEEEKLRKKSSPSNLFHMTHQMVSTLEELALNNHVGINEPVYIKNEKGRFIQNGALDFLEKNIFRYKTGSYEKDQDAVRIFEADDTADEIAFAASAAANLVRTCGYRYSDIAVVCADMEGCGRRTKNYFEECGIPCFLDEKRNVNTNPYVAFIKGIVNIISEDFSYDSVFSYLRSGLTGLATDEIDRMENYVLAAGIRGLKKYDSIWVRQTKKADTEELEYLNSLRIRFMEEIRDTVNVFKQRMSSVKEKTIALYELSVRCDVQKKLKEMEELFALTNDRSREKEYSQIYKAVCDLFDKMVQILGEDRIGMQAYAKLIDAGFEQMRLGIIPTGPDEILIGDIERTRVKNIKAVIFMGINEGLVPKRGGPDGLLNENDRENLEAAGVSLAPSARDDMYRQRFYLYLTLTLASEHIILTYKKKDEDGNSVAPSYLIGVMKKMFPEMMAENTSEVRNIALETAPGRIQAMIKGLRAAVKGENEDALFQMILSQKGDAEAENNMEKYIRASKERGRTASIGREAADAVYKKKYSVSRLQKFAGCAFAHFCDYGLRLEEREKYELGANDLGNIFHETLKNFTSMLEEAGGAVDEKTRNAFTEKALLKALEHDRTAVMLDSGRNKAAIERIKRILLNAAASVTCQLSDGEFKMQGAEAYYELGNLYGFIDRYDVCEQGDVSYVRVIDYKSGETKIDYTKMFYGLQMQLPVYLAAALDKVRKENTTAQAAGIYYLNLHNKLLEVKNMAEDVPEEKFLHETGLSGISLDDPEVFRAQAPDAQEAKKMFAGYSIKKDGSFRSDAPVLPPEDFKLIERYTKKLIYDLEGRIERGEAAINPAAVKPGERDSCRYCPYSGICGYDETIPGYKERRLNTYTLKDICAAMSRKLTGGEDDE